MNIRRIAAASLIALSALTVTACGMGEDDADVVSENLSVAADNFEIVRRIVFYNGITEQYILEITGRCSIVDEGNQLEVVCKLGDDQYKKHFLGLSDNVTYVAEQVEAADVSEDYYRVVFKPSTIIPDIDVDPVSELPENQND